jgi:hypothetical protein
MRCPYGFELRVGEWVGEWTGLPDADFKTAALKARSKEPAGTSARRGGQALRKAKGPCRAYGARFFWLFFSSPYGLG